MAGDVVHALTVLRGKRGRANYVGYGVKDLFSQSLSSSTPRRSPGRSAALWSKGTRSHMLGADGGGLQRLNHLLRYTKGSRHLRVAILPSTTLPAEFGQETDLRVHVEASWAGCLARETTRQGHCWFFPTARSTSCPIHRLWLRCLLPRASCALFGQELERHFMCERSCWTPPFWAHLASSCTRNRLLVRQQRQPPAPPRRPDTDSFDLRLCRLEFRGGSWSCAAQSPVQHRNLARRYLHHCVCRGCADWVRVLSTW